MNSGIICVCAMHTPYVHEILISDKKKVASLETQAYGRIKVHSKSSIDWRDVVHCVYSQPLQLDRLENRECKCLGKIKNPEINHREIHLYAHVARVRLDFDECLNINRWKNIQIAASCGTKKLCAADNYYMFMHYCIAKKTTEIERKNKWMLLYVVNCAAVTDSAISNEVDNKMRLYSFKLTRLVCLSPSKQIICYTHIFFFHFFTRAESVSRIKQQTRCAAFVDAAAATVMYVRTNAAHVWFFAFERNNTKNTSWNHSLYSTSNIHAPAH